MRTTTIFALGFGAGMLFLAVALLSTGRLVPGSARVEPKYRAIPELTERPLSTAAPSEVVPSPKPFPAPGLPQVVMPPPARLPLPDGGPALAMPIAGVDPRKLQSNFAQARSGHAHEALDIMSPRGTPVMAVAEGNVVKLFTSKPGGLTVYQFDNSRTWCYYYAHLDRYATGLKEGMLLRVGDVLGYVGSTGDASPDAPHLHFAVFQLGSEKHWWQGTAIDPLPLLK